MSVRRTILVLVMTVAVVTAMATPAAADTELSITGVSLPESVTQGDSFDIRVSVSGDNLQNNEVDVSLTLPEGLSCSPSGTQTVSLSSGTGEAVFDCTADVEGDYSGEITASASATAQSGSDPTPQSTQTGIEVLSPASLTLSTSLDSSSIDEGSSTTQTVVVHNTGDASTSYQISIASSSGYSTSVASGSASGTVAGGSAKTVEYTVTGDSGGTYTLSTDLSGGNGQQRSESHELSVSSTTTTTTTSGGGGGGGGDGGDGGDSGGDSGGVSTGTTVTATTAVPTTMTATGGPSTPTATPSTGVTDTPTVVPSPTESGQQATGTPTADGPDIQETQELEQDGDGEDGDGDASGNAATGTTPASGPGFGSLVAVVALLATALLARLPRTE